MDEDCCKRCGHAVELHDPDLLFCEVEDCRCLTYVGEADDLEAAIGSDDYPGELELGEDTR